MSRELAEIRYGYFGNLLRHCNLNGPAKSIRPRTSEVAENPVFRNVLLINRRTAVAARPLLREHPFGINEAELNLYRLRLCPRERRAMLTARAQLPAL
jgi:hypothetical protein